MKQDKDKDLQQIFDETEEWVEAQAQRGLDALEAYLEEPSIDEPDPTPDEL